MIRAVLFDFGGVVTTSPFDAFAEYEAANGLPVGLIRQLNAANPDTNAWAQLERSSVSLDEFAAIFEAEAAALGHRLEGRAVLGLLAGRVRPEMAEAVRRCSERLVTACLTNNFRSTAGGPALPNDPGRDAEVAEVMKLFSAVIESSKVGVRKPDPRFYELACETLRIEADEAVFLDDLGINLKPARQLGMTTIKVVEPAQALAELEAAVGFPLT
ncbi:MAG: HAD-IA family hydrolase [Acidimicrobiales bacterium]